MPSICGSRRCPRGAHRRASLIFRETRSPAADPHRPIAPALTLMKRDNTVGGRSRGSLRSSGCRCPVMPHACAWRKRRARVRSEIYFGEPEWGPTPSAYLEVTLCTTKRRTRRPSRGRHALLQSAQSRLQHIPQCCRRFPRARAIFPHRLFVDSGKLIGGADRRSLIGRCQAWSSGWIPRQPQGQDPAAAGARAARKRHAHHGAGQGCR